MFTNPWPAQHSPYATPHLDRGVVEAALAAIANRMAVLISTHPSLKPRNTQWHVLPDALVHDLAAFVLTTIPKDGVNYITLLAEHANSYTHPVILPPGIGMPIHVTSIICSVAGTLANSGGQWNYGFDVSSMNVGPSLAATMQPRYEPVNVGRHEASAISPAAAIGCFFLGREFPIDQVNSSSIHQLLEEKAREIDGTSRRTILAARKTKAFDALNFSPETMDHVQRFCDLLQVQVNTEQLQSKITIQGIDAAREFETLVKSEGCPAHPVDLTQYYRKHLGAKHVENVQNLVRFAHHDDCDQMVKGPMSSNSIYHTRAMILQVTLLQLTGDVVVERNTSYV